MPFIGQDWRSPGEEWVKYDGGWEKKSVVTINVENVSCQHLDLPEKKAEKSAESKENAEIYEYDSTRALLQEHIRRLKKRLQHQLSDHDQENFSSPQKNTNR